MFKKSKKILIIMAALSCFAVFCTFATADDMRETEQARILFSKALEYLSGDRTPPTYQGHRNVTVIGMDGFRNTFRIFDGYSHKHRGYHARIENKGGPMGPKGGQPGGVSGGKGKHQGSPPEGGPGPGGPGGGPGPGGGRGGPRGPKGGPPHQKPGGGMQHRGGMEGGPPDDEIGLLSRLIDFNRPDMSPVVGHQRLTSKKLIKNSNHLQIKGPINAEIAGRKSYMLDISPRYYKGASMRIWLDVDTLLPLKKERISANGQLEYITEYEHFKLVSDDDFAFKDDKPEMMPPGMQEPMRGPIDGQKGQFERPVPAELLQRKMDILQEVTISKDELSFDLINIRKLPIMRLPGVHYVFSDGLNTISIFHFYNFGEFSKDKVDKFVTALTRRLEKELDSPVLHKIDKKNIFIVTSDMSKEDLIKITKSISLRNVDAIKKRLKTLQE